MTEAKCELCGEPMPPGEDMFKFHGYSGPCPKPPLPPESVTCEGATHRWPSDYQEGDTCQCGEFYAVQANSAGLTIVAAAPAVGEATNDTSESACPKCGAWVEDYDGFGVLRHEACGYCAHPSRDGGVCGLCGDVERAAPAVGEATPDAVLDLLQHALNQRGLLCRAPNREWATTPEHRAECVRCRAEDILRPTRYVNPDTAVALVALDLDALARETHLKIAGNSHIYWVRIEQPCPDCAIIRAALDRVREGR